MSRNQFNVRIGSDKIGKVQRDREKFKTTRDIIVEVALADFFSRWSPDERSRFYRNHTPYARS